ncbi:hypothetical protein LY78DRAFT_87250 [Colletotrichum sublineola]|nr:hypothetical protein LY78DRAFT_87250 [Colletotrichum sublineola]
MNKTCIHSHFEKKSPLKTFACVRLPAGRLSVGFPIRTPSVFSVCCVSLSGSAAPSAAPPESPQRHRGTRGKGGLNTRACGTASQAFSIDTSVNCRGLPEPSAPSVTPRRLFFLPVNLIFSIRSVSYTYISSPFCVGAAGRCDPRTLIRGSTPHTRRDLIIILQP